jgi:LDH2 family malate/lactate/ureidoglycolate dehydrogenase
MDLLVNAENLMSFSTEVFLRLGCSDWQSRQASEVLIFADKRGIRSHGTGNLSRIYAPRIRSGEINPSAQPRLIVDEAATALLDANGGLGLVAATEAMDLAVEKARGFGIAAVAVRNSSHFGAASFYSMRAEAAGMIGIAMSNLGSQVIARPPDGEFKMLGTNPISVAAPAGNCPALSLDMSTTAVSTGKIRMVRQRGATIPAGWLVDKAGADVTDPTCFFQGQAELQMLGGNGASGGYKGYGLALVVDALAGLLSGAQVGPDPDLLLPGGTPARNTEHNVGHLLLAIDIARFRPLADFRRAMDRMLAAIMGCPSRPGSGPVVYPGYPEACAALPDIAGHIAMDAEDLQSLSRLGAELELPFPETHDEASLISSYASGRKEP